MKDYFLSHEEVLKKYETTEDGLTESKAEELLKKNGPNKLNEAKKTPWIVKFFKQLSDLMLIILMLAAVVSGITAIVSGESFADTIIIMAVVILNAILGVLQESKAEKAIEALQEMSSAMSKVIRDGKQILVKSSELVVGDVIVLEAGDAVPADARLIECASLKVEESALTGESVAVNKIATPLDNDGKPVGLGDRKNIVHMGSVVVYGRGKAVVTATAMATEMGKIAEVLTKTKEQKTPLQQKLTGLSKVLSFIVLGICVFIFAFTLLTAEKIGGSMILETFLIAVSLAVAAIPEGLATVVTIVLSIGVTKMSKRNALIRKLTAVETLGSAEIICSDKTGTLTQNKMTVVEDYGNDATIIAKAMALSSDAELDEDTHSAVGEPTEAALINFAYKLGINKNDLKKANPRVGEAPFDSMRKMMSTVHNENGKIIQYTKGAPDEVLKKCSFILEDGKVRKITEKDKETISAKNKEFGERALRVLSCAMKEYDKAPTEFTPESLENDLIFIGLVGMIDPVRPEVKVAIEKCKSAGIKPIMITGDHKITAIAIAKELEIITSDEEAITGAELDEISDEELETAIQKYSVYARVQPEHKVRIVSAWKKLGKVTAMTGDGVNDAPSIKTADIGVGMGITGTDVTKNVADMVLADDNFATIVSAVEEGRMIYDNIKKAIQFLLSSNLSEVLAVFFATILGFTILTPVQLLWINLIADTLPALALGVEYPEKNLMNTKPRPKNESIFADKMGVNIAYQGVLLAVLTVFAYFVGCRYEYGFWCVKESINGITMAFLTLNLSEAFHSLNMRSRNSSIFTLKKQNKWLIGSFFVSLILTLIVIYVPFLRTIFGLAFIDITELLIAFGIAVITIPVVEFVKWIERIQRKRAKK